MRFSVSHIAAYVVLACSAVSAIPLDLSSDESIRNAASIAAYGLVSWYNGNESGQIPGLLPGPYYWWEGGAMMMSLIDYWSYTGDAQYNALVTQGMLHQVGPKEDYMTPNQTATTGNDDQAFWGMAAMGAAELNFPDPPADEPQWLALAQAVFETQAARWDTKNCGGGLRWQVFPFNAGYNYKNTISTGCFFNLAARLAKYTGNATYAEWAGKAWDWAYDVGLISPTMDFYDGTDLLIKCVDVNHIEWSYNLGVFLHGAANLYSFNGSDVWANRTSQIITSLDHFFYNDTDVMYERACEEINTCNQDQRSFKAYLARWMAFTTQLAPWTTDAIMPKLAASAAAAAKQCSGGTSGEVCGLHWIAGNVYDGWSGPGEQMAAMAVIGANLIAGVAAPATEIVGTEGANDTFTGSVDVSGEATPWLLDIDSRDKAGAWFLTAILALTTIGAGLWVCL